MVDYAFFVRLNTHQAALLVLFEMLDEELIDFALTVVWIIFSRLDEDAYMAHAVCTLFCHPYRVAKLLFGAQEVEGGPIEH